ncbi:MAG: LTA synthase family protein [Prevotella sp.]|nr:LTA synthase family protein [Prevotella sp.]
MKNKLTLAAPWAVVLNLLLLYIAYGITRLAFFLENYSTYDYVLSSPKVWDIFWGGIYFDTSAIAYTNALYILLVLLPCHLKENATWQRICKWFYLIVNGLGLATNLGDAVYFQYTARRTTIAFFSEFGADDKLGSIVALEFLRHWYLVLLFAALMLLLWYCYVTPKARTLPRKRYYIIQTLSLLVAAFLCWAGMRGGFWDNRPIKISTANQFIIRPNDASLILNTPFSLLRTIGKHTYHNPGYYQDPQELEAIYSPIHQPSQMNQNTQITPNTPTKKNVVVIFLESFGREYIGSLNQEMLPGYKGYTPFLDSLMKQAVSFRYTYANGRASVDAMPSALSGLPMFVESFVAASHATNHLGGMAACLDSLGYETAFFHGAPASSLGFQGFTKSTGFQQCYSQEDFEADPRTNGPADSDNWWGIWDEPFLQYFRTKMSDMKQPFMTALFTLSSHHPFHVPAQYKEVFKEEEMPIHKCIRYTDHALQRFFEEASKEPWFKNTVFVMTGDHTNMSNHPEYKSSINQFSTSIIIYDASGDLTPGIRDGIAQQTDILPTILNLIGYDKPYMAFGCDLLNTPAEDTWAINYLDGIYQYCKGNYVLQFDGQQTIGVYALTDYLMRQNLKGKVAEQPQLEREVKAIIQQYMARMIDNRLVP